MRFGRLLRRRAAAQAGLLALVGLVAALVSGTLVAVLGHVALAAQAGLTQALHDAGPTGAAVQLATPIDEDDPAAQAAAGDQDLAAVLGGLPVAVERSYRSTGLTVEDGGADGRQVDAAASPTLAALVQVSDGDLHGDPTDGAVAVSLSEPTAAQLGVRVGDLLTLVGASTSAPPVVVDVVAIWAATDPEDPRWFGAADGAVWLDPADLGGVPATVRVRWTLVPDPARLSPAELSALRTTLDDALAALKADDAVDVLGVLGTEGLDQTLAGVDRTLSTVRALSLPASLLAALVGLVVLGQLAGLLTEVRAGELTLLRSRGASSRRLVASAGVEGLAVGLVAGAAGAALAAAALRGVGAPPASLVVGAVAGVGVAVAVVLAGSTFVRVRRPLRDVRVDRPLGTSTVVGVVALLVAAAGLGLWRLLTLGSPVQMVGGRAGADPLATAALALALLAVSSIVATLIPPTARTVSGLAARRRDLRLLAVAEVARRPGAHTAAAALVSLAIATAVVVAAILGTWGGLREARRTVETGTDLRVTTQAVSLEEARRIVHDTVGDGATIVTADTWPATFGAVPATLVTAPEVVWPALHWSPADTAVAGADLAAAGAVPAAVTRALADELALDVGGRTSMVVPGSTVEVQVVAVVSAVPGSSERSALLVDVDRWHAAQAATGDTPAPLHEVWVVTDRPLAATADAVAGALDAAGVDAEVVTALPAPTPLLDPALTAFRLATWATVALAAGGLLAAARAGARTRRPDIGTLRGLGVPGGRQAAGRVAEHARALAPALVGGAAGGLGLAALVALPLVRALDDGAVPLPVEIRLDVPALAAWTGCLLVAVALVVGSVARDTVRRARTASPREVAW